ncbi:ATP-grasp domain-containing protein [Saccharicrinis sp. 156]|uniref:ATP-grasp domain-containing protein n=1 Tax=Saccharicrinis sp. 156 TaxID=3417574 RepID=UPI003D330918
MTKIAIHHTPGSFSDRWIAYCDAQRINYKVVNCYQSDILKQLEDCDALMWHFNHKDSKDSKFAIQLLNAVQCSGKKVFPDYHTAWHFDDKLAQKYLFESLELPHAATHVFYSPKDAKEWIKSAYFPTVFKLRNGSGSDNVKLVRSGVKAKKLVSKAFSKGFKQYEGWSNLKERIRKFRVGKASVWDVVKGFIRLIYPTKYARVTGREKGYAMFQDFIPGNDHDIRVVVIGDKAVAIKRLVRDHDFRASGSGFIEYDKELFKESTIQLSFDISKKMNTQCVAFDYVFKNGEPLLVEVSYGFSPIGYDPCPGYWDESLTWYEGGFDMYGWMVEDIIASVKKNKVINAEL